MSRQPENIKDFITIDLGKVVKETKGPFVPITDILDESLIKDRKD